MEKLYCVHIQERHHEIENIRAENPAEAELKAMHFFNGGNYDDIFDVEVMRACSCGLDNDITNKRCEDCGKKL